MKRQNMSRMRQPEDSLAVRGYAATHPSGVVALPTAVGWDQLLYASAGVMTVETDAGTWVIPPHRALWAPDGTPFRIVMTGRVSLRSLYLHSSLAALPGEWRAVNVPPLLRELILHAVRTAPLDLGVPTQERLVMVLMDQLSTLPQAPLQVPLPADPRARAMARQMLDRPDEDASVDDLARQCGGSRRTLERVFLAQTGLTIGQWRRRLRLVHALRLLAAGESVTAVAPAVGYSTPSAFGAMFREELGETPGRYFREK
jgi:AraC-like DNA-binding protein